MEERRYLSEPLALSTDGNRKIVGYAAVFDSLSEEMPLRASDPNGKHFREVIKAGAFAESIRSRADVVARFEHDSTHGILGRVGNGTLRLLEDSRGLRYEIDPPDTSLGHDVVELIRRRDVAYSSFAFRVRANGEMWRRDGGNTIRELRSLLLIDVSPVTRAAYPGTEAALRSFDNWQCSQGSNGLMKMRLELAERV